MRKQTGSRNREWLPSIGNRLSVAVGVALAAGLLAALAPRAEAVSATGGAVTNYTDAGGTKWTAHIFTTVGTTSLTVQVGGQCEVLVVGGGGGGGMHAGGGGGAGGVIYATNYTLTASPATKTIVVGDGGAGAFQTYTYPGSNGTNSVFDVSGGAGYTITANGGGGGAGYNNATSGGTNGVSGGSGGGGGTLAVSGTKPYGGRATIGDWTGISSGVLGYGNAGGRAWDVAQYGAGGGGGAGAVGADGTGSAGGNGGTGVCFVAFSNLVPSTVGTIHNGWFGGGGGGGVGTGTAGAGGKGGGGKGGYGTGSANCFGTNGVTNTGGGGGGGNQWYNASPYAYGGGKGGSGIVIVRYLAVSVSVTAPINNSTFTNGTTSLSATATVVGGVASHTVKFYTNSVGGGYAEAGTSGPGPGPFAVTLTGLANDSTNYIYAVVTDSANATNTSSTNTFYISSPVQPTVSVTAPTNNQTFAFRSTVTATGTVSGLGPFTVVFYTKKDTGAYGTAGTVSGVGPSLSLPLGALDNGTYGICAVVTDNISQVAYSLTNTFYVSMPAVPTVSISSPTNNQVLASGTSITATGTVNGAGTPLTVTFYTNRNGSAFGPAGTSTGSGSSFTNALGALGWGTYGVYAVVTDVVNQAATSVTNTFYVAGVLPTLSNRGATEVTTGSATFNGFLSTTGNPPPSVYVLYSMTNNVWSFTNALTAPGGVWTNNSPLSTNITGLASGRTWYYTFGASNASPVNATVVASPATNLITGEVTVQCTSNNAQYKLGGSSNGQFTIYRPATCTNAALVVSYTLTGATVTPSGSATLNAGSTSAVVTVVPSFILGYSSNAVLTLTAGNYPYGTPANSATCTVLATDVTPTPPFLAWGGDVAYVYTNYPNSPTQHVYYVHKYTNTAIAGYFVPSVPIKRVDYLIVGGGGAGGTQTLGWAAGGGGGAGGCLSSNMNVTAQAYTVIVGTGGANGNGSNSVFGSLTAFGGGKGGDGQTDGFSGGSGGGAGTFAGQRTGGSATNGQGYAGGNFNNAWGWASAAGGGGASTNGGDNSSVGGAGGAGISSSITGTALGYAGGGGGGGDVTPGPATGYGGGAGGPQKGNGYDATPSTGGGGGGAGGNQGPTTGGKGGSGIVIVRYEIITPKGTLFLLR